MPTPALHGELTVVRPATEADADLLAAWHADPEVARYWDHETYTVDEMRDRLRRREVDPYVIEAAGEPVGYLQAWIADAGDEGGIDMFLVPEARGRGLGPDAARTLVGHLLTSGALRRVTVDPYLWNEGAIRGWKRAGFRPVEARAPDEDHLQPWLLMEFDPD